MLAVEGLEELAAELGAPPFDPLLARRNVVLRGADVEALRGRTFTLGGVTLLGGRAANPCRLDGRRPGARGAPRAAGRGGVRCRPLTDGVLRLGPAELVVDPAV